MLGVALSAALFAGMTQDVFAASVINGSYVKGDNENNPLVTQSYGADPGVMVYNDTVYVVTAMEALGYLISTTVISQRQRVLSLQRAFLLLQLQFKVTETAALK